MPGSRLHPFADTRSRPTGLALENLMGDQSLEFTVLRSAFSVEQEWLGMRNFALYHPEQSAPLVLFPVPQLTPRYAERETPNGERRTFIPAARSGTLQHRSSKR